MEHKLIKRTPFKIGDKVLITGNIPPKFQGSPMYGTVKEVDGLYVMVKPRYQRWVGEWMTWELKHIETE